MKKFSAKQLAQQQKFKEMILKKSADKKAGSTAPASAAPTAESSSGAIWVALGVVILAGLAYWYFTKDKSTVNVGAK